MASRLYIFYHANSNEHEISLMKNKVYLALKRSDVLFKLLRNVKMPTIVGISTFMSMMNLMLSSVEHDKVLSPWGLATYFDRVYSLPTSGSDMTIFSY